MKLFTKILLALLFVCEATLAQVNVVVNLPPVMPSELTQWRDNPSLVTVIFNNTGASLSNLRIGYKIRDLSKNTNIITTKDGQLPSNIFNTGANLFTGHSLFSFPNVEINSEFYNTAATTNSLPEGQYEFCLYVLDAAGTLITLTGSQCAYFQVIIPQAVSLLQPINNISYVTPQNSTYPMFLWTPAYTQGVPVTYRLRIVPVFQGQAHYDAINTNPTIVNRDLTGTNYQYSPSDPSFELYPTATKFAWQVRATNQFGNPVTANDGRSDVFCFAFNNNQPNPLAVSGVISGCEVNTGRIVLTVTGGTAPYTYAWKKDNTAIAANSGTASNLANGNYSVLITDNEGDTVSARFRVNVVPVYYYPSTTNSTCGGSTGSITIGTLSGGTGPYRFEIKRTAPDTASWRGAATANSTLRSGLRSGTYTVTITDSRGCSTTKNATISDNNNAPTAYINSTNVFCPGTGKIYFRSNLSSPYRVLKFEWRGPNNFSRTVITTRDSLLSLDSGIYTYTATDTITGCIKSGQISIGVTNLNTVVTERRVSNATQGMEDGEFYIKMNRNPVSITLTHQDGTNYTANVNPLLDETTATIFVYNATGLKDGNYTMRLFFGAGNTCEKIVTFRIASCAANFTTSMDSAAYYYRTTSGTLTMNNVPNGAYTVKIIRANGTTALGPYNHNSTGQASATRSISIRNNLAEGGYTAVVTHNGGCVAMYQFTVYRNPKCEPGAFTSLAIAPVQQRTQMWCWLTCGEMIFRHHGIAAPRNMTYQCHIISFYYPACAANCGACVIGANGQAVLRDMIQKYSKARWNNDAQIDVDYAAGSMTTANIKREIDAGRPIITGISPSGTTGRPVSEHVALLIGYADGTFTGNGNACFVLKINDPYPYPRGQNPYLRAGGKRVTGQTLQYEIEYDAFRTKLVWQESFSNIRRTAL